MNWITKVLKTFKKQSSISAFTSTKESCVKKWNCVPISVIEEHFKVFVERKNRKGEHYLTKEQLNHFIDVVFREELRLSKKMSINFCKGEKGFVIKRFWEFYDKCYEYNGERPKELYIRILTDNFSGMDYDKVKHFFNGNKCNRNWE